MRIQIETPAQNGVVQVALLDQVTQKDFTQGKDILADCVGANCYRLRTLINLSQTTFIDSSGIGWLLGLHKRFTEAGGEMILHSVPLMVQHVFSLVRLNKALTIVRNEQEALTHVLTSKATSS